MKKIFNILYTCLALLLLVSCNNGYESVFSESADERVKKAMEEYRTILLSSPDGWKATMVSEFGGAYMFYFDFKEDGTVTMISDFNDSTAQFAVTGTYLMKALQRITLSFDTYSYVHLLADPDGSVNGGVDGIGLGTDFEFAFDDVTEDNIALVGIQRDTPMKMVLATSLEKSRFLNGDLKTSRQHAEDLFGNSSMHYYLENQTGDKEPLGIDEFAKIYNIFYLDDQNAISKSLSTYVYSLDGIQLNDYVSTKSFTFNQLLWDDIADNYYILNNGQKVFVQASSSWIEYTNATPKPREELITRSIIINPGVVSDLSQAFRDAYSQTDQNLSTTFGNNLGNVAVQFVNASQTLLGFEYTAQSSVVFFGYHVYSSTITSDDVLSFTTFVDKNTSNASDTALTPLLDYFRNNSFKLVYVPDPNLGQLLIKMTPEGAPADYTFGVLQQTQ